MRVLVTGAGGLVGAAVRDLLGARGATRAELDITDADAVERVVAETKPDVIVNAAAYTDVDGAESNRDQAFAANAEGVKNLAQTGPFLIHLSTDFVFDGTLGRAYTEYDEPNPTCVYAASKLAGERRALEGGGAVVRTAWVYGGASRRSFLSQILDRARDGETLRVVTDQAGSPTWVADLADGIAALVGRPQPGVFHLAGGGVATRFEFAQAIVRAAGMDPAIVTPVVTDELPPRPARRPAYAPLEPKRWVEHGFTPLRDWREALAEAVG